LSRGSRNFEDFVVVFALHRIPEVDQF
jgi:hypothetical protein